MLPDQEPEAVQAVVFVELQVKVDDPPEDIEEGLAERLTVGGGVSLGSTVTVLLPIAVQISKLGCPNAWPLVTLMSKVPPEALGEFAPKMSSTLTVVEKKPLASAVKIVKYALESYTIT